MMNKFFLVVLVLGGFAFLKAMEREEEAITAALHPSKAVKEFRIKRLLKERFRENPEALRKEIEAVRQKINTELERRPERPLAAKDLITRLDDLLAAQEALQRELH